MNGNTDLYPPELINTTKGVEFDKELELTNGPKLKRSNSDQQHNTGEYPKTKEKPKSWNSSLIVKNQNQINRLENVNIYKSRLKLTNGSKYVNSLNWKTV